MEPAKITLDEIYQIYPLTPEQVKNRLNEFGIPKSIEWTVSNAGGITEIRIRSVQTRAFGRLKKQIQEEFLDHLLVGPNQTIVEKLVETLIHRHHTISLAESMTGGMIASLITGVENASKILKESFVVYSDAAKSEYLGVSSALIKEAGVTSETVAEAMVKGLYQKTNRDICVSVTGVAGPASDEQNTPIGTVYIGLCVKGETTVLKCLFRGSRNHIRAQASMTACAAILNILKEEKTT